MNDVKAIKILHDDDVDFVAFISGDGNLFKVEKKKAISLFFEEVHELILSGIPKNTALTTEQSENDEKYSPI